MLTYNIFLSSTHFLILTFFLPLLSLPFFAASLKSQLFDMSGKMPGIEKLGAGFYSGMCRSKPERMLDRKHSSGYNIKECLLNLSSSCLSIETNTPTGEYSKNSNRRGLLKRVQLKDRKRREQGWLNGHPNELDFEMIQKHVLYSKKSCFIISRECIHLGLSSSELIENVKEFPVFEKRSWGSCAIVGLSDDMLLRDYGNDIDAHDVVIRMGHLPLLNYKKYVGSRSDIIIYRPGALKRDQKGYRPSDVKAYLCKNPAKSALRKTNFMAVKNSGNINCDATLGKNDVAFSLLNQIYSSMSPRKVPTTGTLYAIRLAFSRLCNRLDIYGISSGGGGTYFEPEAITKQKHGTELDSWLLHHLMKNYEEELKTCIYT